MSRFTVSTEALSEMDSQVIKAVGKEAVLTYASAEHTHELLCGCGAGGNCSSSCVSGCAERGSRY